jgi:hypothetical protein
MTESNRKGKTFEEIYGKERAEETREAIGKFTRGRTYEEIYGSKERAELEREKRREPNSIIKKRLYAEGKLKSWNKNLTKETDERIKKGSEKCKKRLKEVFPNVRPVNSGCFKEGNHPKTEFKKGRIVTQEELQKSLRGLLKRPTSFEQKISDLCMKYHLPFVYTGDGRMLINFKNPDFVNEKDKIAIEVFLNYFKIRDYGSIENYMKVRSETFAKSGYKTIFIREEEIMDKNWEEICLNKLNDFKNKMQEVK